MKAPKLICNPVDKNGEGILDPESHLVCYEIELASGSVHQKESVFLNNQIGSEQVDADQETRLCVPAKKTFMP